MTASLAQPRSPTRRDPLARYRPRCFGQPSRWRFVRDRRTLYLGRVSGSPSEAQKALIESLIELEWGALRAEHVARGADLSAMRDARENRRLFQRLLADFEKSCASPPLPPPRSLDEAMAYAAAQKAIDRR